MLETVIFSPLWPPLIIAVELGLAAALTRWCLRLYGGVEERFAHEGGLMPEVKRPAAGALLRIPVWGGVLFMSALLAQRGPQYRLAHELTAGALLLLEAVVVINLARNAAWLLALREPAGATGSIVLGPRVRYGPLTVEMVAWGALFGLLAALFWSAFLLGGALSCAVTGAWYFRRVPP